MSTFRASGYFAALTLVQSISCLRRHLICSAAASLLAISGIAIADTYPSKPVKIIVGNPPGGPSDFLARLYSEAVGSALGQAFLVDNKAGASGTVAAEAVAKSASDGHTLLLGAQSSIAVAPYMYPKLGYDPAKDFVPVSMIAFGGYMLVVHPSVPVRNVEELVALLRSKPGTVSFGSGGNGAGSHLCAEQLSSLAGGRMLHVPYKGDGPAFNDLLGGQIKLMFATPNVAVPQAKAGKLRILAVTTKERLQSMPDVPSVHESGLKDFECVGWSILFAPAGTPKPVLDSLRDAWSKARTQGPVKARLDELGMAPPERFASPDALGALLKAENVRLGTIIRSAGIKPE